MYTHVVLLRGVNVGGAKRVPMAMFKKVLHKLGCDEVETILNSGNAVVSAPEKGSADFATTISDAIRTIFGFEVPVIVSVIPDFQEIVKENKLISSSMNASRLLVIFSASSEALRKVREIADRWVSPATFLLGEKAAYLYCPDGISQSEAAKVILGKTSKDVTTRNWATVLKLHALASSRAT